MAHIERTTFPNPGYQINNFCEGTFYSLKTRWTPFDGKTALNPNPVPVDSSCKFLRNSLQPELTFVEAFKIKPETALLSWFLTLDVAHGVDASKVELQNLFGGNLNSGVYKVLIDGIPRFVIKITDEKDTRHLLGLNDSELFTTRNPNFPTLIKLVYASKLPNLVSNLLKHKSDNYLQLLSFGKGERLKDLPASPDRSRAFFVAGKKIAALNEAGWSHNDLHQENILYDKSSDEITLVDLAQMSHTPRAQDDDEDDLPAFKPFSSVDVIHLAPKDLEEDLYKYALSASSSFLESANKRLADLVQFAKGYSSALEGDRQKVFRAYVRQFCGKYFRSFGESSKKFPLLEKCKSPELFSEE